MALNYDQQVVLKAELDADPMGLGYAGKDTNECSALLNQLGLSSETLPNISVSVDDVLDALDPDELPALPISQVQFFLKRLQIGSSIDISPGSPIIGQAASIFTVVDANNTRIALNALTTRDASRGEILFSPGITITHTDVGRARQVV